MDHRLTRFAVGAICAWIGGFPVEVDLHVFAADTPPAVSLAPAEVAGTPPHDGEALVRAAVQQLKERSSISAKVRHRIDLFDQRLVGSGVYMERAAGSARQIRFSLSVSTQDRMVNLLHVCDGRYLWMHDNLDGRPSLVRVDLHRLRQASVGQGGPALPLLVGSGLPRLLATLRDEFQFAAPRPLVYQRVPMWALIGHWRPNRLADQMPSLKLMDGSGRIDPEKLPPQLPDHVFLLLGRDDWFPYHIDLRRSVAQGGLASWSGLAAGDQASRSLVTMELFDVQFDVALDPKAFVYTAGSVAVNDQTDELLSHLQRNTH
jgi:hypothetical protein